MTILLVYQIASNKTKISSLFLIFSPAQVTVVSPYRAHGHGPRRSILTISVFGDKTVYFPQKMLESKIKALLIKLKDCAQTVLSWVTTSVLVYLIPFLDLNAPVYEIPLSHLVLPAGFQLSLMDLIRSDTFSQSCRGSMGSLSGRRLAWLRANVSWNQIQGPLLLPVEQC